MSEEEAKGILRAEFIKLRGSGFPDLVQRLAEKQEVTEVDGLSGTTLPHRAPGFLG